MTLLSLGSLLWFLISEVSQTEQLSGFDDSLRKLCPTMCLYQLDVINLKDRWHPRPILKSLILMGDILA